MPRSQSYATHRNFPLVYFGVATPLTVAALVLSGRQFARQPSWATGTVFLAALAAQAVLVTSRVMANTVQNRVIRLEMRLRLREVLPPDLLGRIGELRTGQLIALRFAGDGELPGLVRRCLAGELVRPDAIKRAITDWQSDFLRA